MPGPAEPARLVALVELSSLQTHAVLRSLLARRHAERRQERGPVCTEHESRRVERGSDPSATGP